MINKELGMVDKLIFEAYKDKPLWSSNRFKSDIKLNYGFIPNSNLYREIINYQIKKYGKQLDAVKSNEYVRYFCEKNSKSRRANYKRVLNKKQEIRFLDRVENDKKKR